MVRVLEVYDTVGTYGSDYTQLGQYVIRNLIEKLIFDSWV